jgi:hypothetical protein
MVTFRMILRDREETKRLMMQPGGSPYYLEDWAVPCPPPVWHKRQRGQLPPKMDHAKLAEWEATGRARNL